MNFFEMLVVSQKLSFADGKVTFYGQDTLIFPVPGILEYVGLVGNNPELAKELYHMAKESVLENKSNLLRVYKSSDALNWVSNTINLYGLGKIVFDSTSNPVGRILVTNSPFVIALRGKVAVPTDHILRGIIAGMISALFNKDYDVIEIECEIIEGQKCRFLLDTKENLAIKFADYAAKQI